jgi:hypothetical protein
MDHHSYNVASGDQYLTSCQQQRQQKKEEELFTSFICLTTIKQEMKQGITMKTEPNKTDMKI